MFARILEPFGDQLAVEKTGWKPIPRMQLRSRRTQEHPHQLDFHSVYSPAFWIFWLLMLACILVGFIPQRASSRKS